MVENVQQIEAMLAAYIDDELTPDERAELERHLEANPAHRALILELTGHSDLLRSLPREPAPEDLSEPLESVIERDALLGGGDPLTEFKSARTRRWWPQLLAAAAIFILAFGLGAIVFYVLPPKHPTVAIVQPPEFETSAEPRELRDVARQDKAGAAVEAEVASVPAQADAVLRSMPPDTNAPTESPTGGAVAADSVTSDGTLVITITANDVQQASGELRAYFASNGIAWSEAGTPEAIVTLAKATSGDRAQMDLAASATRGGRDQDEPTQVRGVERVAAASPAPSQTGASRERRATRAPAPAVAPTTSPVAEPNMPPAPAPAGNVAGTVEGTSATDHYVVFAALSGTQAERLATTFGRRAELRREALPIPAVKQQTTARAMTPQATRSIRVGLASETKVEESLKSDAEEFKLLRPPTTTRPADVAPLWLFSDDGLLVPTTRPAEPFALGVANLGRELEGQLFNCVVVLRKPEEASPTTQPATPTTRPVGAPQ